MQWFRPPYETWPDEISANTANNTKNRLALLFGWVRINCVFICGRRLQAKWLPMWISSFAWAHIHFTLYTTHRMEIAHANNRRKIVLLYTETSVSFAVALTNTHSQPITSQHQHSEANESEWEWVEWRKEWAQCRQSIRYNSLMENTGSGHTCVGVVRYVRIN